MERVSKEYVKSLVCEQSKTHLEISELLKKRYPGGKGFSERSVRRFCKENDITRKSGVNDEDLDVVVREVVSKVGPTWGRKMVTGYLHSKSICVAERRVGKSLIKVAPRYHNQRKNRAEQQTNPLPYHAEYFGHKLHVDQNEKLGMYGVVHVCAIDGYSGMVVSHALMPVKNNLLIYDHIYRQSVLTYGLWDQIRVDKGREFSLMLFVQELLKEQRTNPTRLPYIQTTSKENHRIERLWVEINLRVNYPVKRALNSMVDDESLDMEDDSTKFCVSWVSMRVCFAGCCQVIDSWNSHRIPGKGIPKELQAKKDKTKVVPQHLLPTAEQAVKVYEEDGGQLTYWSEFGADPLPSEMQIARQRDFEHLFPNIDIIFQRLVNSDVSMFRDAVKVFRNLTLHYSSILNHSH